MGQKKYQFGKHGRATMCSPESLVDNWRSLLKIACDLMKWEFV